MSFKDDREKNISNYIKKPVVDNENNIKNYDTSFWSPILIDDLSLAFLYSQQFPVSSSCLLYTSLKSSSLFNTENNLENFSLAFIISANEANCPALSSISNPYRLFFNIDSTVSFVL